MDSGGSNTFCTLPQGPGAAAIHRGVSMRRVIRLFPGWTSTTSGRSSGGMISIWSWPAKLGTLPTAGFWKSCRPRCWPSIPGTWRSPPRKAGHRLTAGPPGSFGQGRYRPACLAHQKNLLAKNQIHWLAVIVCPVARKDKLPTRKSPKCTFQSISTK